MHQIRYFDAGRVCTKENDSWRTPSFPRTSAQSKKVRQESKASCVRQETSTTLLDEVERILNNDLEPSTIDCYQTAVKQYREFIEMSKEEEFNPTERTFCEWIAYESLFLEPKSVAKYVQAVKYYLDAHHKGGGDQECIS